MAFRNGYKAALLMGVAASFVAGGSAFAQTAAPAAGAQLEEIIVTGSRIVRPELTSSSPVVTVDASVFQHSGTPTLDGVLNRLPQVTPALGASSNNGGNGTATVDLRNIGASRTLVLVNGRRYIPTNGNGTVDLNNIPAALIKQVQVLTGGASAVYGSDAVAGVVNFILRDDFRGVQATARYGTTSRGDAGELTGNFMLGTGTEDGRSNVVLFAEYNTREALFAGDRAFSRDSITEQVINGVPTILFAGSSTGVTGRLQNLSAAALPRVIAWNSNGTPRAFVNPSVSGYGDNYNFAPVNYLRVPQERFSIFTMGHHEVNDHIRAYAELNYVNNRVPLQLAETPVNLPQARPGTPPIRINLTNPLLTAQTVAELRRLYPASADPTFVAPPGFTAADYASITTANALSRRMTEVGPRAQENNQDAFNATFGLDGDLLAGFRYDTYMTYGRVARDVIVRGDVSAARMRNALDAIAGPGGTAICRDAAARAAGCVPIDIFGEGRISPAAAAYVRTDTNRVQNFEQLIWNGSVTGNLFALPAGDVGVAAGAEYRKNSYSDRVDDSIRTGDVLGFNPALSTAGSFDVWEVFGEAIVPLVANVPFIEYLGAEAAYRYSDYSSVGGVQTYKGGVQYAPVKDISFRGQYQRAVRAPNVLELFQGGQIAFPSLSSTVDPCLLTTAPRYNRDFCIAQGVPAGVVGTAAFNANRPTQYQSLTRGAAVAGFDLREEKTDTWTVGAVFTPTFIDGFSATIDWWQIKLDRYIAGFGGGAAGVVRDCFTNLNANSPTCRAIARTGDGYLAVVQVPIVNNAGLETSGIDVGFVYTGDLPDAMAIGGEGATFRVKSDVSYRDKFKYQAAVGGVIYDVAGYGGNLIWGEPTPKWKATSSATYASGPLSATLTWNYMGSWKNEALLVGQAAETLVYPKVKAWNYFDVSASYSLGENVSFTAGVNNLFDKDPPMLPNTMIGSQQNTFSNTYDVLGQRFFISTTVRF